MADFKANLNLWKFPKDHDPLKILGLGSEAKPGPDNGNEVQQILPFSYPTKQSNVDALSKTVRSRTISLQLFRDVILKNYRKNENRAAEDKAKFDELANEREYFKVYVPTTMERKDRLTAEVDDLREQSHSVINDKANFERMRSNYEMKMSETNNLQKNLESHQGRVSRLEQENERLRMQVSGNDCSVQNVYQDQCQDDRLGGQLVQSSFPAQNQNQMLPDNILDGKRSGYSDHNASVHYQQNPLSSNMNTSYQHQPRMSQQYEVDHGRQSQVSYTGGHANFSKNKNPMGTFSTGGGNNPLNFNYAKQGNF